MLATKYRPKTFEEVLGQDITVKILKKQIEKGTISSAYLFEGATGCGKTTLARLFNKYVNGGDASEPIEIDAASNSGVDNVRNIIQEAQERSISNKYKVFIIDECHSLSNAAWQAFLKCIEETPPYTIFIFCTTEIQKVPETIKNRCQIFTINRISEDDIFKGLTRVCEGINYEENALKYIAQNSNNSLRTALSILDKCLSYEINSITFRNVLDIMGINEYEIFFKLANAIIDKDQAKTLELFNSIYKSGKDIKLFVDQYLDFYMDLNKYSIFRNFNLVKIPETYKSYLDYSVSFENSSQYFSKCVDKMIELKSSIRYESYIKTLVEAVLLQMARGQF